MRVLFVNRPNAEEQIGGDTIQMRETARALRELGVEVDERLGPQAPATYESYDLVHLLNLQTPAFTVVEAEKAKAAGRKLAVSTIFWDFGADLLIAESPKWARIASIVGLPIAKKLAQRRVESVAAADRAQMRRILELADVCLPNSQAEIAHLRRVAPNMGPARVVPNGIDSARFDPARNLGLPTWAEERGIGSKEYLLVVARLDSHKNQAAFCQAMRGFPHLLVLVGQTGEESILRQCQEAGAIYVGRQSGDELVASFFHARVHALPSFRETPGLASIDAAAMGCAIVSTEAGCAREYFGDEALYCNPRSPASMRAAVEKAWTQGPPPSLSPRIRKDYTWQSAAQTTLAAYNSLAS